MRSKISSDKNIHKKLKTTICRFPPLAFHKTKVMQLFPVVMLNYLLTGVEEVEIDAAGRTKGVEMFMATHTLSVKYYSIVGAASSRAKSKFLKYTNFVTLHFYNRGCSTCPIPVHWISIDID
jgi:hypothetical protein